nr:hypothetical protein [Clostridium sp. KNHs214]
MYNNNELDVREFKNKKREEDIYEFIDYKSTLNKGSKKNLL